MTASLSDVKLLLFDVFGTLVDWRRSIARSAEQCLQPLGLHTDWLAFADAWRAQYQPSMEAVRSGQRPFCKLDELHRQNLETVLAAQGWLSAVPDAQRAALTGAWHRLDAWADVTPGLAALRTRAWLAPCSNGNVSLMADLARHNGWHWDAILGAEWARDYKPQPVVYLSSAAAFDCAPEQTMMVAAHSSDLAAAAACGLRTAFIARPDEHGPGRGERQAQTSVDVQAESLLDLAAQLARSSA